jgi:hypothetical protein
MMRLLGVTVVGLLAIGCGRPQGEPDQPSSSTGLGTPAMPSQPGANGQCNDLAVAGAPVTDVIATAAPALSGGAMVDGTYVLTKYEWYTPNQIHTHVITLQVTGGGTAGAYLWQRDSEPVQHITLSIATSGAQIALRATCPVGADPEWDQYGMTDTGLVLYSSRDTKAAYFARQ